MDDAYEKIGSIVERWCEENMYTTMLVTISIGYEWETPHEETHVLEWDCESHSLVWEIDWWEGQQHVELVGFTPTYKIRLVGADAEVAPVRHGRWTPDYDYTEYDYDGSTPLSEPQKFQDGWQCSLCGQYAPSETNYCPNCGAKMDKEEQT